MRRESEQTQMTLPEILGVPTKGIIFSDLDGVWFDEANNFSAPNSETLAILKEAKEAGFLLVLNSDTAPATLAQFAKELGFDPAVIGENGSIIAVPEKGWTEYVSPLKNFFTKLRQQVVLEIMQREPSAAIIVNDATPFIRSGALIQGTSKKTYIINTARECSLGIYTRGIRSDGSLYIYDQMTRQTQNFLNELLSSQSPTQDVACFSYPTLGSSLVKPTSAAKWIAVKNIVEQFPQSLSYFMLGDRIYDSMEPIADKVVTCAVGNADDALKAAVRRTNGIIAPENLTIANGANYLIREIIKRSNK